MKDLTKGNITKLIICFAMPVLLGNLLELTYNLVDMKIVSQILGEDALAAVGATSSLNTLIVGFLTGLTNGFSVIAAQYFGANDIRNLKKTVALSLKIGLFASAILTFFSLVFLMPLLRVLNTPEEIITQSYDFIFVIFAGMTILMVFNVCCSLLRAIGDTITPLLFLAGSVGLNIIGDYLLMAVIKLGVRGAAIATVTAQLIAMIACIVYMYHRYEILRFEPKDLAHDASIEKKLLGTGLSMGFMSSLVSFGTVALQTAINTFGTAIIVAHTAARKITEMYMLMFTVLGTTMATFCGQNLGAGKIDRIKKGIRLSILISWIWSVGVILITYTVGPQIISALTSSDNPEIIQTASLYLRIDTLLYFVTAMITVIRNSMQGIGDHITPIISSLIELVGKVLIVILLVPSMHYMGIIVAEPIIWVLMVIPLIVQILRNPLLRQKTSE